MLLLIVFFLSGLAALIYQVAWHRVLYSIYGIDITSVTMVVTAFMIGLGVGSLFGGFLSRRASRWVLPVFAALEFGIGVYGLFSLEIFAWAAEFTLQVEALLTGIVALGLVIVPTTFMGASLPLLVGHSTRSSGNVGRSVGALYFANTLGAAAGCIVTVGLLFSFFGIRASVQTAALINLALGVAVLALYRREGPAS